MLLRGVTRNLGRRSVSQHWMDAVAAAACADLLFLQEVAAPAGLVVPEGY
jgi:hypothetical protein